MSQLAAARGRWAGQGMDAGIHIPYRSAGLPLWPIALPEKGIRRTGDGRSSSHQTESKGRCWFRVLRATV